MKDFLFSWITKPKMEWTFIDDCMSVITMTAIVAIILFIVSFFSKDCKRIVKRKKQLIVNGFFNKRIGKCRKCGCIGVLTKHGSEWHVLCMNKNCRNHSKLHRTRMATIKDWNYK